jgi:ABC-2 type transport system permease protein
MQGMADGLGLEVTPQRLHRVLPGVHSPSLGSSQYPWPSLENLRWFQVITALNPMTYVSEGLRAAMVPRVPHIDPAIGLSVLTCALLVLFALGLRGFYRRAIN